MSETSKSVPKIQRIVAILWPSFVVSGIATILFFTLFDPVEIIACIGGSDISRMGYYSIGFFMFWLLTSLNSVLTCYFLKPCSK
ncbi:MAG: hypothetical protein OEY11_06490 [Gammaproteobacteria bacterium]|nr:hypothetical protein [Gammaproteobacteria bacterium]